MEHRFRGPPFTLGIEEELMIVDGSSFELVNAIETMLSPGPDDQIKPELLESVLEISTAPHRDVESAAGELAALRRQVHGRAQARGLTIVDALALVLRQELLFGLHVHVGVDDPETAIAVANGMRRHIPILLALSANSPFWRGQETGLMSTRTPIFRSLPRVGVPPYYDGWEGYQRRIDVMVRSGVISDYTYLWYDVRPHPDLGTVEIRAMDAQTRVEETIALAALCQALVKSLYDEFRAGERPADQPAEMLDENKWLAARYGLDAELVDLPGARRVSVRELIMRELPALREHAQQLGSAAAIDAVAEIVERGNGAQRQLRRYRKDGDLLSVMAEIVELSAT
jgi:carboxylate-amine ligase